MMVGCPQCGRTYDDAQFWTLCPHTPLGTSPEPYDEDDNPWGYCRKDDRIGPHECSVDPEDD